MKLVLSGGYDFAIFFIRSHRSDSLKRLYYGKVFEEIHFYLFQLHLFLAKQLKIYKTKNIKTIKNGLNANENTLKMYICMYIK